MEFKKGTMVKVIRDKLDGSLEAQANDPRWSSYVLETLGEVVELRGEAVQVKFAAVPTPPIWFNKEQLQVA